MKIGLSGGIGSGKSTVAAILSQLGAVIIDSDRLAREVVEPGSEGFRELIDVFGSQIVDSSGALDRNVLSKIVFGDDQARKKLNAITHPRIAERTAELVDRAGKDAVIVQDTPLLVEVGMAPLFHLVIIVDAPESMRLHRLESIRGMSNVEAKARIDAQANTQQRRLVADIWIDNTGSHDQIQETITQIWYNRILPYKNNISRLTVDQKPYSLNYDPYWQIQADRIINRLWFVLSATHNHEITRIEHIGSTAIANYAAHNVVDIQISCKNIVLPESCNRILAEAGFIAQDIPQNTPLEDVLGFYSSADPDRPVHIYIYPENSVQSRLVRVFPQFLAQHSDSAREYSRLKLAIITDYEQGLMARNAWFADNRDRIVQWADTASSS